MDKLVRKIEIPLANIMIIPKTPVTHYAMVRKPREEKL